jgi:hypothetical protein
MSMSVRSWLERQGWVEPRQRQVPVASEAAPRTTSGEYRLLHKYLLERYADRIFLTFAEVEDLLGFKLPDEARLGPGWWTEKATALRPSIHSAAWTLASRIAVPNVPAQFVVFERMP